MKWKFSISTIFLSVGITIIHPSMQWLQEVYIKIVY